MRKPRSATADKPRRSRKPKATLSNNIPHNPTEPAHRNGKQKRVKYTADQQRSAVAACLAVSSEHPYGQPALDAARRVLGAPIAPSTLEPWLAQYREEVERALLPGPSAEVTIRKAQEQALNDLIEIRSKAAERAKQDDKLNNAAFRDLMVGVGIAGDHIAKMVGVPAEVTTLYRKLEALARRNGDDAITLLDDFLTAYEHDTAEPLTVNEIAPQSDNR